MRRAPACKGCGGMRVSHAGGVSRGAVVDVAPALAVSPCQCRGHCSMQASHQLARQLRHSAWCGVVPGGQPLLVMLEALQLPSATTIAAERLCRSPL